MQLTCFKLEKKDHRSSLYMFGVSTREALEIFLPLASLIVTEFEASKTKRKYNGWISAKDLPSIANISEMIAYLDTNNEIGLIDFTATIDQEAVLSTHDDCEAHFLVLGEEQAIDILGTLAGKDLLATVLPTILSNPGKYVGLANGQFKAYSDFWAWVNGSKSSE